MNTRTRNYLLTFAALVILAVAAVGGLMAMGSQDAGWTVNLDGDTMDGLAGAGFAFGGLVIGIVAAVFALAIVGAVLAGVSLFLMGLFVFIALAILLALAPVVLPVVLLVLLISFIARKKRV